MFRRLMQSYYAKITLICIVLVSLVTGFFSIACYRLISREDRAEQLAEYQIAIATQSAALSSRLTSFSDFFYPLFSDDEVYEALGRFYLSPSGQISHEDMELIHGALKIACNSDSWCCGILLLTRSGKLYQYDKAYDSIIPIDFARTRFTFTPYQMQILTESQITQLNSSLDLSSEHVYGLTGTMSYYRQDSLENLGYLIALYSTDEFQSVLSAMELSPMAAFSIYTEENTVIYSSEGNYEDTGALQFDEEAVGELLQGEGDNVNGKGDIFSRTIDGTDYYSALMHQSQYHYYTACQLSAEVFTVSVIQSRILLLTLLLPLSCIFLYSVVLRSSGKKVEHIRQSMEIVGQNHLSYRMPAPSGNDEFADITRSFNHMCDELQKNVENVYLFEISQHKASLYALQTSINPHFLYNALEQIRVQILQKHTDNASHMLLLLSRMYRYQTRRNLFVSIAEECGQTEHLISLYSYRISDCEYDLQIDGAAKKFGVPKNILQPLVENAFVHGFSADQEDAQITIEVTYNREDGSISFCLENNGTAVPQEQLIELSQRMQEPIMNREEEKGFALSNVNNRLRLVFGEDAGLTLSCGEGGTGFRVFFTIPAVLPEELAQKYGTEQEGKPANEL